MAINYQKVGWDTTKYFNPTNMNHMDDGIKAACDKADANEAAIADVNSNLNNTTMCSYAGTGATVSTTDWEYHGTNITIPNGYYALVVAEREWANGKPSGIAISLSDTENTGHSMCTHTESVQSIFSTSFIVTTSNKPVTVYLWSKGEVGKSREAMFATLHKST